MRRALFHADCKGSFILTSDALTRELCCCVMCRRAARLFRPSATGVVSAERVAQRVDARRDRRRKAANTTRRTRVCQCPRLQRIFSASGATSSKSITPSSMSAPPGCVRATRRAHPRYKTRNSFKVWLSISTPAVAHLARRGAIWSWRALPTPSEVANRHLANRHKATIKAARQEPRAHEAPPHRG
jgi:hypothetical protein